MKIFIICSVRGATDAYRAELECYAKKLEAEGHAVHLPHRDTKQDQSGINICKTNRNAIEEADEVHLFYETLSQGTHFDMGIAFANRKPLVVVRNESYGPGKSFSRMADEWAEESVSPGTVYLAGPIYDCTDAECKDWRKTATENLTAKKYTVISPMVRDYRGTETLAESPAEIVEPDKHDIDTATIILAYCPKPSIGTSMEILYAFERNKTVLVVSQHGSPWLKYHATWMHPTLEDALNFLDGKKKHGVR